MMGRGPMGQQGGMPLGGMPMGGQQPGPWGGQPQQPAGPWGQQQRGGGMGFLGTAAMTAAGVAGGMLAANAISNMFSGGGAGQAQAAAGSGFSPVPPTEAPQQPASYQEPNNGYQAEPASYDDGSDYGGGGDDWA
jgi:uncharacterized protein